ncbi:type II toxin-antitoxin system RelE/ParE family toxin [Pseudomonas sp. p106]|uniref:type II toxin-antitoxin system RelE/ParE family toxin n=1 Tax=Pseudomonas sp. p106 TaxID=2479854 RepID=UPI000F7ABAEB|nr:type II toxin-antitoxin system RelE/ParE family toxin [Pseudomonas sp. p106]RRV48364.1 addiction module toxin RelE [Pseudomonas sp. p106]
MAWTIRFCEKFISEFYTLDDRVQERMLGHLRLLQSSGPALGRPHVDTLNGSRYPNMKELRFTERNAVWRVAFAFDPDRQAVILVAGDKCGVREHRFYQVLIKQADTRFENHLSRGEKDVQDA